MFSRKVETLVWSVCMQRCRDFRNSEVYSWVLARKPSNQPWMLSFHIDDNHEFYEVGTLNSFHIDEKYLRSGGKFYVNFIYANLSKVRCDWTLTAFCAYIYVGCLIQPVRMKKRFFYWQIDHGQIDHASGHWKCAKELNTGITPKPCWYGGVGISKIISKR